MALTAKIRGRWRVISKSMARVLARKGIEVVDSEAKAASVPSLAPPTVQFAISNRGPSISVLTPAHERARAEAVGADEPPLLTTDGHAAQGDPASVVDVVPGMDDVVVQTRETPAVVDSPVRRKCSLCGEPGHTKAKCPLAELDALTTPES